MELLGISLTLSRREGCWEALSRSLRVILYSHCGVFMAVTRKTREKSKGNHHYLIGVSLITACLK